MQEPMCIVPGCEALHRGALGYCNKHYLRQWAGQDLNDQPEHDTCQAQGCEGAPRSRHADYCEMHYTRLRRTGSLDIQQRERRPCINPLCNRLAQSLLGYCKRCRERIRNNGHTQLTDRRLPVVSYSAQHMRLRSDLGPASRQECADCGQRAAHWSYDHADPDEMHAPEGAYSLNPDHYLPRCVPCHKRFDLQREVQS